MTVVIIEDDYEYLLNAPRNWKESGGFELTEQTFLGQPIYHRGWRLAPIGREPQ